MFAEPVTKTLDSCSWLLTGATGFLGSVLIEQLLRTCNPSKIVLVMLPKAGESPQFQIRKLLSRPLYNLVREQYGGTDKLLERFEGIERDLSTPDPLHFPPVDVVVHAAASISFNNHIHDAINANYKASQAVAAAAMAMPHLRSFVHVSTCYVNGNLPRGSHVAEEILPLEHQGQTLDYKAIVEELVELPREDAERKAMEYRTAWHFPNNYTLTKRLSEHLLLDRFQEGLPLKIVRPSIIGGTSMHHVLPGYIGNAGGSTAFALGVAFGMWVCTEWKPERITDLVPADYVSSAIILAAAAEMKTASPSPLILQSATSGTDSPMLNSRFPEAVARKDSQHPAPFKVFPGYPKPSMEDIYCSSSEEYRAALRQADTRVWLKCWGLRLAGRKAAAEAIATRWRVFKVVSGTEMDFDLVFSCANVERVYGELSPEEQKLFPCVWRKGVDDWDAYLGTYMEAVWERYVARAGGVRNGRPRAGMGGKKNALAATAGAVTVVGVAYLWRAYMPHMLE